MIAKELGRTKVKDNKYSKVYWALVERGQKRSKATGFEAHHILPKGKYMFPEFASFKEHQWNRTYLTFREHYICHLLLTKMTEGKAKSSAIYGLMRLCFASKDISSKDYALARSLFVNERTGTPNPNKGKPGRVWTDEQREYHRKVMKEKMASLEVRLNCSLSKKGKPGPKMSDEAKAKIGFGNRNLTAEQRQNKSRSKIGDKNGMFNKKWFNNGIQSKSFTVGEEPEGWKPGRLMPWLKQETNL